MMQADPKLLVWITEYGDVNVLPLQSCLTDGLLYSKWPHAIVVSAASDATLVISIIPIFVVAWLAHGRGGYRSSF